MGDLPVSKGTKGNETIENILRNHVASLNSVTSYLSDFNREMNATKKLVGNPDHTENKGAKLIKIGTMLIAFPDPTPTTYVAGAALVAAGMIEKKTEQPHLCDIPRALNAEIKNLENLKRELAALRI